MALADVAALSDLHKATAHRLLTGLVKAALACGGQGGRAYDIGPRLSQILHATATDGWLEALARPILAKLAETSGEACYLTRLVGSCVMIAVSQAPEVPWRSYVQPGVEMPPHATATGKAIIAYQNDDLIQRALSVELPKLTANTHTDKEWILEEFERVRERGYATCVGEVDEGLAAIAAPVRHDDGLVLYSVGISGPLPRVMGENLPKHLRTLADTTKILAKRLSLGARLDSDVGFN